MGARINSYKDLWVFQNALHTAMRVFLATEQMPSEDKYSLSPAAQRFTTGLNSQNAIVK